MGEIEIRMHRRQNNMNVVMNHSLEGSQSIKEMKTKSDADSSQEARRRTRLC